MKLIKSNKKTNNRIYIIVSVLVLIINILTIIFLGEDSHISILDNLDSNIVSNKILINSGLMFASNDVVIEQIMNGLPRSSFTTIFNLALLPYYVLGTFWGYVCNKIFLSIIAFVGMFLLLEKHILPDRDEKIIQYACAVLFALLPFWGDTISVAGIPIIFYAFLNLRSRNKKLHNWIIILIFPFYSSLIASGLFVIILLVVIGFYDVMKKKAFNYNYFYGIVIISFLYLFVEYRLLYSFIFDSDFQSHRKEMSIFRSLNFKESIKKIFKMFNSGSYHTLSLQRKVIVPTVALSFLLFYKKLIKNKYFLFNLLFIIITSVFYGIWAWEDFLRIRIFIMSILPFNISRFFWLHPMMWYLLFAISLAHFINIKYGKMLVVLILSIQLFYIHSNTENYMNIKKPTYREFFAEKQFIEIKEFIAKEQNNYRVVCVGIHPAVALFNGFYTLDGYSTNYPLSYKHQFREIIANELNKNDEVKDYFDKWGSRCYVFSAELNRNSMVTKNKKIIITDLDLNNFVLKEMGAEYIISAVEINTNKYKLLKIFENDESAWKIFLYKIL